MAYPSDPPLSPMDRACARLKSWKKTMVAENCPAPSTNPATIKMPLTSSELIFSKSQPRFWTQSSSRAKFLMTVIDVKNSGEHTLCILWPSGVFFLGLDTPHSEVHFYMMHIAYAAGGWALPVRASTSPSPTWTRKLPHVEEKVSCRSFDDMQNKMSLQLLFVKYICIFIQYIYMYCIKVYIMFDEILSRNKKCPEIYSCLIERRCVLH